MKLTHDGFAYTTDKFENDKRIRKCVSHVLLNDTVADGGLENGPPKPKSFMIQPIHVPNKDNLLVKEMLFDMYWKYVGVKNVVSLSRHILRLFNFSRF